MSKADTIDEILDTYYAPIKLPDNNRKELVATLSAMVYEIIHGKPPKDGEMELVNVMIAMEHAVQDKRAIAKGFTL